MKILMEEEQHMQDHKLKTFNAISSFVQDLNTEFGKKYKPVALYNRLIERTTIRDFVTVDKHIQAFKKFFESNPGYIKNKSITTGMVINYSERIFLDLSKIFSKTSSDSHKHIHQHLFTIYTLLNIGTQQGREALESLRANYKNESFAELELPNTTEGNFVKNTMAEMVNQLGSMEEDNVNPMAMIGKMMSSGFVGKFMGELETKFQGGEMNISSLMNVVSNVITSAAPPGTEESKQLKNIMDQGISQITQNNEDIPNELKDHMSNIFNMMSGPMSDPKNEQ